VTNRSGAVLLSFACLWTQLACGEQLEIAGRLRFDRAVSVDGRSAVLAFAGGAYGEHNSFVTRSLLRALRSAMPTFVAAVRSDPQIRLAVEQIAPAAGVSRGDIRRLRSDDKVLAAVLLRLAAGGTPAIALVHAIAVAEESQPGGEAADALRKAMIETADDATWSEFLNWLREWNPLRQAWTRLLELSLARDRLAVVRLLSEISRNPATTVHQGVANLLREGRSESSWCADRDTCDFLFWHLTRAAEPSMEATQAALMDIWHENSRLAAECGVDVGQDWRDLLLPGKRSDSAIARSFRLAVDRDPVCATVWAAMVSKVDSSLCEAFLAQHEVEEHKRIPPADLLAISESAALGGQDGLPDLADFRVRFVAFAESDSGWMLIRRRLIEEVDGLGRMLRENMRRELQGEVLWSVLRVSVEAPGVRDAVRSAVKESGLPDALLRQLGSRRTAASSGVYEEFLLDRRFAAAIAEESLSNVHVDPDKPWIIARWIGVRRDLMPLWNEAVEAWAMGVGREFAREMRLLPSALTEPFFDSLTRRLVENRLLFEHIMTTAETEWMRRCERVFYDCFGRSLWGNRGR